MHPRTRARSRIATKARHERIFLQRGRRALRFTHDHAPAKRPRRRQHAHHWRSLLQTVSQSGCGRVDHRGRLHDGRRSFCTRIGDHCYFTNAVLLCELELRIGSYVLIGWNATVADTDFHPLAPAARVADAIACSPLGKGRPRPEISRRPVIIDDDVWIGPNAAVLKGVHIGAGAFIEAGSLVTRDVPPRARVLGNPAQVIGEMS
ncbi:MAG: acyltransferase [Verrucomicrobia bacterium]|nr:MAG: acyltransferase [Verrucomicrobiota bacterium]